MATFNVRVVNEDYDPIEGTPVVLESPRREGKRIAEKLTDAEGYANFEENSEMEVKVSIKGTIYGKYHSLHGRSIVVTL